MSHSFHHHIRRSSPLSPTTLDLTLILPKEVREWRGQEEYVLWKWISPSLNVALSLT